ncbi:PH domain-containing protein [Dietzia psychralcaliphila]|uniref:PH domain-containing protein n=1 Tax=Dietzia psychralcaliphila TaxID=139021 RepID=UPI000D307465|nr:PH domain-containing protein [Dietzia psychralcaliphila]PTM85711.1 putative membrane protein [Dietzia psychralcaliphila]
MTTPGSHPVPAEPTPQSGTTDQTLTTEPTPEWLQLDPRTVAASTVVATGALAATAVPAGSGLLLGGVGLAWVLLWTIGGTILGAAATAVIETVRLAVTRYRVDPHRIERRVRFLSSSTTSLSTGRVRNVEISADLVQRRMGIATVRLASGETDGARLTLGALDREVAEDLRRHLLAERAATDTIELVRLDPGWVRYAPASVMTPLFGILGIGIVFQVADWFGAVPEMLEWIWGQIGELPIPVIAMGVLLLALVVGTVASVAVFVENWWNLRLDRHEDGSLELRRGLLVGRHTSFDGRRVRGVTLHEPPGFRLLGAARLDVVASGVGTGKDDDGKKKQSPALVPPSPRDVSAGAAETILGEPVPTVLRAHPPAARRRRLVRAVAVIVVVTVAALVPAVIWTWLWWVPVAALALSAVVAIWAALDNARGLGHEVTVGVVALRKGSLMRRTDILGREGILGWNIRRSPLQRRAGLATLVGTTAGGSGAFRLPDVGLGQAPELWRTAGPVWDHLAEPPG